MNRREFFLKGCAAAAVAIGMAPLVATPNADFLQWYKQWLTDTSSVFIDAEDNLLLFGVCAIKQIDTYPFIESVAPSEIYDKA